MTSHGVTLLHVGGVPVRLDASWLLIAVAVVWSLTTTLAAPGRSTAATIAVAVVAAVGFFASILAHELGHALAARRRDHQVHGITLFVFGGMTAMDDDARTWRDEFVIAAIGPWVSCNLAALLGIVTASLDWFGLAPTTAEVLGMLGWLNLGLAVFNLVPGAPLDGGRVLRAVLWPLLGSRRRASRVAAASGVLVGLGLWGLAGTVAVVQDGALVSALWLTLVAAFIVAIAGGQWRGASPARWQAGGHGAGATDDDADAAEHVAAEPVTATGAGVNDGPMIESATTSTDEPTSAATDGPWVVEPGVTTPGSGRLPPLPPRRRWVRWTLRGMSTALVLGGLAVPMPIIEESPGPTFDVGSTIELSGPTTPLDGELVVLTVFVRQPGIAEVVRARVSENRSLRPIGEVVGPEGSTRDYFTRQSDVFASAFEQAAAAALDLAGEEVDVVSEVLVGHVLPGAPADGLLQTGDVVLAVDGEPVETGDELAQRTADTTVGTSLTLSVRREGVVRDVEVVVDVLPGGERSGLGITVGMQLGRLGLPREIDQTDLRVGGPSAGLVTALAIYDLVQEEDLLAGRTIAVTGTMAVDGTVGSIGGIDEKVEGAVASGAELLVVPLAQVAAFEAAADGRLAVIGVATLDGAVSALRGT